MRLSDFIRKYTEEILQRWEDFAASIGNAPRSMNKKELRDHASLMLETIADDLDTEQNRLTQTRKGKGLGPRGRDETAAEAHGGDRLECRVQHNRHGRGVSRLACERDSPLGR